MKYRWIGRIVIGVLVALVLLTALGWLVMSLWNWLLPSLLGWPQLSLLQAIALLALCRILFGGMRPRFGRGMGHRSFGHRRWRARTRTRWANMTEAEREKLRAGLRARCMPWHSRSE